MFRSHHSVRNETILQQAQRLRNEADALCDMRDDGSSLLYRIIRDNPNYHSWELAGTFALFQILDKVDGVKARKAARLLGETTTPEGAEKDHATDHKVNKSINSAIGEREFLNGHTLYGATFIVANSAMVVRDEWVDQVREAAREDGLEAKSRPLGKWKQLVLGITQTVAVSPLASPDMHPMASKVVRPLVASGMVSGTAMSALSAHDVYHDIAKQREELQGLAA